MLDWNAIVTEPIKEMLTKVASFIPTLVGILIILVIGWVAAKIIKGAVIKVLKLINFERISHRAGISDVLTKGDVKLTATNIIGGLAYWLVMIMVLVMVVNALGLTVASELLEGLLNYIPRVIAAVIVLVIGMFLGNFISGIVNTAARNADLPKPEMLADLSKWAIIIFALIISLKQLGIAPLLVTTTFNISFGGVCLALALAFGIGGKEAAAKYLEELRQRHSMKE